MKNLLARAKALLLKGRAILAAATAAAKQALHELRLKLAALSQRILLELPGWWLAVVALIVAIVLILILVNLAKMHDLARGQ